MIRRLQRRPLTNAGQDTRDTKGFDEGAHRGWGCIPTLRYEIGNNTGDMGSSLSHNKASALAR